MSDSVPFGPITAGTTYSVSQWNSAWASKVDVTNGSLVSPTITGTPTAPTATPGTSTTQIATTAFVNAAGGAYVPLSGGTLTGALTLPDNPTSALQAAPKQYVDAAVTPLFGSTSSRPTGIIRTGTFYLDTTLGQPIWWDGSAWVNAAGGVV